MSTTPAEVRKFLVESAKRRTQNDLHDAAENIADALKKLQDGVTCAHSIRRAISSAALALASASETDGLLSTPEVYRE